MNKTGTFKNSNENVNALLVQCIVRILDTYNERKTLIIAPLIVVEQWMDQLHQFAPGLRVLALTSEKIKLDLFKFFNDPNHVYLINLEKLVHAFKKVQKQNEEAKSVKGFGIFKHTFLRIIVDEEQALCNVKTLNNQRSCFLKAKYRWILSGELKLLCDCLPLFIIVCRRLSSFICLVLLN